MGFRKGPGPIAFREFAIRNNQRRAASRVEAVQRLIRHSASFRTGHHKELQPRVGLKRVQGEGPFKPAAIHCPEFARKRPLTIA
ncbi:MAG: hypothetical protein DHS20C16_27660 [Phycisphaerae bacterium]|nr:MAG: hypothetical protein DHS20C16_27660 [Phycisphaerae bacterium]